MYVCVQVYVCGWDGEGVGVVSVYVCEFVGVGMGWEWTWVCMLACVYMIVGGGGGGGSECGVCVCGGGGEGGLSGVMGSVISFSGQHFLQWITMEAKIKVPYGEDTEPSSIHSCAKHRSEHSSAAGNPASNYDLG